MEEKEEVDGTSPIWNSLPDLVLAKIFSNLGNNDRFSASLVCERWSEGFKHPKLWRTVIFDPTKYVYDRRYNLMLHKFLDNFGQYVQEAEVRFTIMSQEPFRTFLSKLIMRQTQLLKFTMRNLYRNLSRYWSEEEGKEIIKSICNFMRHQHKIQHFDITDRCDAKLENGLRIIEELAKGCGESVQILKLVNFFDADLLKTNVGSVPLYETSMVKFTSLKTLSLNYNCLQEAVIKNVVKNCSDSLKDLSVTCCKDEVRLHQINSQTWSWIRRVCPDLRVNVRINEIEDFDEYKHIIPPQVPMKSFSYSWTADSTSSNELLTHLAQHFRHSLERLDLNFDMTPNFEDNLLKLLLSCDNLNEFKFYGVASVQTVHEICRFQKNGRIKLKHCKITLDEPVMETDEEIKTRKRLLEEVASTYSEDFQRQGVEFKLQTDS